MSGDPYWGWVSLLLRGEGVNGSTVIVDSSARPKLVSVNGNARISTAQSRWGGSSLYFDGAGDYLSFANSSEFDFGSGDFTVDFWLNTLSIAVEQTIFCINTGNASYQAGARVVILPGGALRVLMSTNGTSWILADSSPLVSANTWMYVELVRVGNAALLFANGVQAISTPVSGALFNSVGTTVVGCNKDASYNLFFNGYLNDFRVSKWLGRNSSNFTPPTTPVPGAPDWWGTVRHGERASARPVTSPRKFTVPRAIPRSRTRADNSAGLGSIVGTVKVDTLSVSRKVRLFDVASGRLLKEVWSDSAGVYRFDGLALDRPYTVLSHDHQRDYNATVADYVYAEVLP